MKLIFRKALFFIKTDNYIVTKFSKYQVHNFVDFCKFSALKRVIVVIGKVFLKLYVALYEAIASTRRNLEVVCSARPRDFASRTLLNTKLRILYTNL